MSSDFALMFSRGPVFWTFQCLVIIAWTLTIASIASPNWLEFKTNDEMADESHPLYAVRYGPFYTCQQIVKSPGSERLRTTSSECGNIPPDCVVDLCTGGTSAAESEPVCRTLRPTYLDNCAAFNTARAAVGVELFFGLVGIGLSLCHIFSGRRWYIPGFMLLLAAAAAFTASSVFIIQLYRMFSEMPGPGDVIRSEHTHYGWGLILLTLSGPMFIVSVALLAIVNLRPRAPQPFRSSFTEKTSAV